MGRLKRQSLHAVSKARSLRAVVQWSQRLTRDGILLFWSGKAGFFFGGGVGRVGRRARWGGRQGGMMGMIKIILYVDITFFYREGKYSS